MASLGGMTSLESLDLTGCRGQDGELETRVWAAIGARRAALDAAKTRVEEAESSEPDDVARQLLAEARRLREAAAELLRKAEELDTEARARRR